MSTNNIYCVNNESLFNKTEYEFSRNLRQIMELEKELEKFEDPNIHYNPGLFMDKNMCDNNDEVVKKIVSSFFSRLHPIEYNDSKKSLNQGCATLDLKCFLSSEQEKDKILKIDVDGEIKCFSNISNSESLKEYFENIRIEELLNGYISKKKVMTLGYCIYDIKQIYFHDDFSKEYRKAPKEIVKKVNKIFICLLMGYKKMSDYDYHDESESVENNSKLKNQRRVLFNCSEKIILQHLKITKDWSLYGVVSEKEETLYFGKLTPHLKTKKYK